MNNVVTTVKDRATAQLDTQKGHATAGLDAISQAVRQTTAHLRSDQHDTLAQYIDQVADQLDRLSSSVRQRSVNELMQDVRQLGQRQPALFIGGSFAVGLLAARFLKSSQRNSEYAYHSPNERAEYPLNRATTDGEATPDYKPAELGTSARTGARGGRL